MAEKGTITMWQNVGLMAIFVLHTDQSVKWYDYKAKPTLRNEKSIMYICIPDYNQSLSSICTRNLQVELLIQSTWSGQCTTKVVHKLIHRQLPISSSYVGGCLNDMDVQMPVDSLHVYFEMWMTYHRHILYLVCFHQQYLEAIMKILERFRVLDIEVLQWANISSRIHGYETNLDGLIMECTLRITNFSSKHCIVNWFRESTCNASLDWRTNWRSQYHCQHMWKISHQTEVCGGIWWLHVLTTKYIEYCQQKYTAKYMEDVKPLLERWSL